MVLSILIFSGRVSWLGIVRGYADWQLWLSLTIYRLSWFRACTSPISALEGTDRGTQLHRRKWLFSPEERIDLVVTILGLLIELIAVIGVLNLMIFLFGFRDRPDVREAQQFNFSDPIPGPAKVLLMCAVFFVMSVTAAFYVSIGFAIYLCRRTVMEGWDLEMGFKKLLRRLGIAAMALVVCIPSVDAIADVEAKESARLIEDVLAQPDFNQAENSSLPKHLRDFLENLSFEDETASRGNSAIGNIIAELFKLLLIGALIYALFLFFYKFYLSYGFDRANKKPGSQTPFKQSERSKKLPSNVLAVIRKHWEQGETREALALLYNASVVYMDGRFTCAIRDCDTEGECLRKTRGTEMQARFTFVEITNLWRNVAYGGTTPTQSMFDDAISKFTENIMDTD